MRSYFVLIPPTLHAAGKQELGGVKKDERKSMDLGKTTESNRPAPLNQDPGPLGATKRSRKPAGGRTFISSKPDH